MTARRQARRLRRSLAREPEAHARGGLVAAALGLGWLAAGDALGSAALVTWNDAREACPVPDRCPDARGPALAADARLQANPSTGAFVLFVTAPRAGPPRGAVGLSTNGLELRARW